MALRGQEDTFLSLAEQFRESQGEYCEMDIVFEVDGNHEGSSSSMYAKCTKNPGHPGFIPLPHLGLHNLPDKCGTERHLDTVRKVANLSVKLFICHTSAARPETMKTNGCFRCGTGFVEDVFVVDAETSEPRIELRIFTAAHVVFDEEEARSTTVELFFDSDNDKSGVVRARGKYLEFVTPDADKACFIAELSKADLGKELLAKLQTSLVEPDVRGLSNMTFTVSHPHGVAKRVTFGSIVKETVKPIEYYNVDTVKSYFKFVCDAYHEHGISEKRCLCFLYYCVLHEEHNNKHILQRRVKLIVEKSDIVKSLVRQSFLEYPSCTEIQQLYNTFKHLMNLKNENILEMTKDAEALCRYYRNEEIPGDASCTVVSTLDKFQARWRSFDTAIWAEFVKKFSPNKMSKHNGGFTANYRLETCAGTSGSRIFSIMTSTSGETSMYVVPHSRGRSKEKSGISGGGVLLTF